MPNRSRKSTSVIWSHFNKLTSERAECKYCKKSLSYKTTVTNLKQHLKQKHERVFHILRSPKNRTRRSISSDSTSDEDPGETRIAPAEDNEVWDYFEHETGGRARCVVCRRSLANEVSVLRTHLQKLHPKLVGALKFSDEAEDTKDFLNFDDGDTFEDIHVKQDKQKSKIHLQASSPQKIRKKRLHCETSSDDEFLSKTKDDCKNEELDVFLKYVGTLLKDIPKDLFTKLQCNIINMIMTTKINHDSTKNDVPKEQNSEYYIVSNKAVPDMPPPQAVNDMEVPSRSIVSEIPTSNEIPSSSDVIQNDDISTEASSKLVVETSKQNNDNDVGQNIVMCESIWAISDSSHTAIIGPEDGHTNNEIDVSVSSEPPVVLHKVRTRIDKKYPDFTPP